MTCPTNPEHGRVFDLDDGVFFCSHSDHDKRDARSRSRFTEEEVFSGHVKPGVALAPKKRVRRK